MQKIYNTEVEYIKCFSDCYEDGPIIRFTDSLLGNMYSHNLTYIKYDISDEEFVKILSAEAAHNRNVGKGFVNIQFDFPNRPELLGNGNLEPAEVTSYDYYFFPVEHYASLKPREDCVIKKLDNSLLETALELDLRTNGEDLGADFVKRRFERRSMVYLEPGKVDNYICIHNDEAVGHCDLFINGNVAKIEDFDVAPDKQRQGYGTAILKEMIRFALEDRADTIYLITDHSDTAKDMYEKLGFIKVASKTEMLFAI
jgi:spore maturation protein CgeE